MSGAIHCRACGRSRRCPSCDVALTLHADGRLHCHHCGFSEKLPDRCPECGSVELARIGAGTQRLEAELERRVPGLERIRLDADTTMRPNALAEALERFANARAAALIGTQMVAKGHHFPGVAVAAVVDADTGLAFPDFRSEERTFQLVTQLAGRSGRDASGVVLVQTLHYFPFIWLNTAAALSALDRSLEEAAQNLGSSGFRLFRRVLLPLSLPGYAAGALLTFIRVIDDLGTPLMLNYTKLLAPQAYLRVMTVGLTDVGRSVLAGESDRVTTCGIDRWLGGVHLQHRLTHCFGLSHSLR